MRDTELFKSVSKVLGGDEAELQLNKANAVSDLYFDEGNVKRAFIWGNTPQGDEYWENIYDLLTGTSQGCNIVDELVNTSSTNEVNLNKTGDTNMKRSNKIIEMFDDSKGIEDDASLVYETTIVTSEVDDNRIIQQLLLEDAETINKDVDAHNDYRMQEIDQDILQRTGREVNLQPVKFKDLRIVIR